MIPTSNPKLRVLLFFLACIAGCASPAKGPGLRPPSDPIASVAAEELRSRGLGHARAGDLTRAQQYLSAAHLKGFDERVIVPEIVKVCVAASRLRAALLYAEPYLLRHPDDAAMSYVVGTIHLALGNVHRASAHLSGALEPRELMIDAAFSLALIAEGQGDREGARGHLKHYLRVQPSGRFSMRARRMLAALPSDETYLTHGVQP